VRWIETTWPTRKKIYGQHLLLAHPDPLNSNDIPSCSQYLPSCSLLASSDLQQYGHLQLLQGPSRTGTYIQAFYSPGVPRPVSRSGHTSRSLFSDLTVWVSNCDRYLTLHCSQILLSEQLPESTFNLSVFLSLPRARSCDRSSGSPPSNFGSWPASQTQQHGHTTGSLVAPMAGIATQPT
jgi:hypothetical protein